MITTNRRRQFGKIEDKIEIIHPQWWNLKFRVNAANTTVLNFNSPISFTINEVVSKPDGATITQSGNKIIADKVGSYEIYFTVTCTGNTAMYYGWNCVYYSRLPSPYMSNGFLRPVYMFGPGGSTQRNTLDVYIIRNYPPSGPNNTALGGISDARYKDVFHVYVPKGSIENYVNNSNTRWKDLYNRGQLLEVNYKIVED